MSYDYADATLTIDLAAIVENYRVLSEQAASSESAAVVKANAYGLGVKQVALALHKAGCEIFFVATLDEGIELRSILPDATINVFHGVKEGQESVIIEYSLIPVLNNSHQFSVWSNYSIQTKTRLKSILHIDTGMNRLGFSPKELPNMCDDSKLKQLDIQVIMSHLACASRPQEEKNQKQLDVFLDSSQFFSDIPLSIANSSGIYLGNRFHLDLVRPGSALYGVNPLLRYNTPEDTDNPMKNVVTLRAKILQIREIDSPQTVGYGATRDVGPGTRLATVAVGYADGYLRALSNVGHAIINNVKVPLIGRVSMDMIIFDVTEVPENTLSHDTEVELLGPNCPVDTIAEFAGTIGYEILTSLGNRYQRMYANEANI